MSSAGGFEESPKTSKFCANARRRMREEAAHLAADFLPQLLSHVARSAGGERIDAVRNADVEFFAHAVRWDDAAVRVALVTEQKHGNAGMLDHLLSLIGPLLGKSRRAGRDLRERPHDEVFVRNRLARIAECRNRT